MSGKTPLLRSLNGLKSKSSELERTLGIQSHIIDKIDEIEPEDNQEFVDVEDYETMVDFDKMPKKKEITFWDFGGHVEFHLTHFMFLQSECVSNWQQSITTCDHGAL